MADCLRTSLCDQVWLPRSICPLAISFLIWAACGFQKWAKAPLGNSVARVPVRSRVASTEPMQASQLPSSKVSATLFVFGGPLNTTVPLPGTGAGSGAVTTAGATLSAALRAGGGAFPCDPRLLPSSTPIPITTALRTPSAISRRRRICAPRVGRR